MPNFKPDDALAVLRGAAADRQPIAIFEVPDRAPRMLLPILLTPLFVWLATPCMRPFRWRRVLRTSPVPLVPLTCFWDGIVSQLRAYTPGTAATGRGGRTDAVDSQPRAAREGKRAADLPEWDPRPVSVLRFAA